MTISPHRLSHVPPAAAVCGAALVCLPRAARGGACPDRRRRAAEVAPGGRDRGRRAEDRWHRRRAEGSARRGWTCRRACRRRMASLARFAGRAGSAGLGGASPLIGRRVSSPCPASFRPMGRTGGRCCWRGAAGQACRARSPIWGRAGAIWRAAILARPGVKRLDLVEAEADALDCARRQHHRPARAVSLGRCHHLPARRPVGRRGDEPALPRRRATPIPGLGAAFIRRAAADAGTRAGSSGWLPTATCPMTPCCPKPSLSVEDVAGDGAFRVIHATKPIRAERLTRPGAPPCPFPFPARLPS